MLRINLHIHTIASDGALGTEGVIQAAVHEGIDLLSITDHDAIDSTVELSLLSQSSNLPFRVLSGVEIDCTFEGKDIEILGYGFDVESKKMNSFLRSIQEKRKARMEKLLKEIKETLNIADFSFSDVKLSGRVTFMKPHVAQKLVEKKIFKSFDTAIRYVKQIKAAPLAKPTAQKVCDLIAGEGGVAVLAHPWYYFQDRWEELDAMIRGLASLGLAGLEVFYPYYERELSGPSPFEEEKEGEIINNIQQLASREGLIPTAGTDAHGKTLGSFLIDKDFAECLEK